MSLGYQQIYPYEWSELARKYPNKTGEEISSLVYCSDAQEKAAAAARAGKTRREQTEIYEREMSTALCFVAGAIIKTENGDEVIEDIQVGDYVWA